MKAPHTPNIKDTFQTMKDSNRRKLCIHRCRFLEWTPEAVVTMASSRSKQILAVARDNGNVEIRRVNEKFRVVQVVQVGKKGHIKAMAWSSHPTDQDSRLYVGSLDGSIYEINFTEDSTPRKHDSYGGAVWSMAHARDRDVLAVGCEDGSVKLFRTGDGYLQFERSLPGFNSRILAIAWQPGGEEESGLYIAGVDGIISHVDARTGHSAYRMTVEKRNSLTPALVWCLKALPDGTLVSGDSLGNIHFWDGNLGTLIQSFSLHEADILTLESSDDGNAVFASGVDSKLVCLKRNDQEQSKSWILTASNRAHSHDVTALSFVNRTTADKAQPIPLLISAGKDTKLCTYSVAGFAKNRPRYIAPYPYHPVGAVAAKHASRLLLMQHDRKLHLWRMTSIKSSSSSSSLHQQDQAPALEIQSHKGRNIVCSAISGDGDYVAYATLEDLRIFSLSEVGIQDEVDADLRLTVRRVVVDDVDAGIKGVTSLAFTPTSHTLVLGTQSGNLHCLNLKTGERIEVQPSAAASGQRGNVLNGISMLSCHSEKGACHIAIMRLNGEIEIWILKEDESLLAFSWRLPRLDSPPTTMAYHSEANILVVACTSNRFYLFDGITRSLADWSKELGHRLPPQLLDRHDCIVGIAFNPQSPNCIILYGFGFICYVDLDRPPGNYTEILPASHPMALAEAERLKKSKKYQSMRRKWKKLLKNKKAKVPLDESNERKAKKDQKEIPSENLRRSKRRRGSSVDAATPSMNPVEERGNEEEFIIKSSNGPESPMHDEDELRIKDDRWNFKMHFGYQGILSLQPIGQDEFVMVEEPWIKIVNKLPDVLYRHRYRT